MPGPSTVLIADVDGGHVEAVTDDDLNPDPAKVRRKPGPNPRRIGEGWWIGPWRG